MGDHHRDTEYLRGDDSFARSCRSGFPRCTHGTTRYRRGDRRGGHGWLRVRARRGACRVLCCHCRIDAIGCALLADTARVRRSEQLSARHHQADAARGRALCHAERRERRGDVHRCREDLGTTTRDSTLATAAAVELCCHVGWHLYAAGQLVEPRHSGSLYGEDGTLAKPLPAAGAWTSHHLRGCGTGGHAQTFHSGARVAGAVVRNHQRLYRGTARSHRQPSRRTHRG